MKRALFCLPCLLLSAFLPLARAEEPVLEDPNDPVAVIKTTLGEIHVELFVREAPKTVENFLGLAEGTKAFKDPKTGEMVKRPYYDGLIFHRVIPDFMIQGGCPLGTGMGSPGFKFEDEIDATALGLGDMLALPNGRINPLMHLREPEFRERVVQPLFRELGITSQATLDARKDEVQKRLDTLTVKGAYELMGYRYQEDTGAHKPVRGVLAMANSGPNTNGSQFFIDLKDTDWLTGKHTVFGKVIQGMDVVEKIGAVKTGPGNKPLEDVQILSIRRRAN
jgi:peptidyl-prolyl cis-trans isomerase A (cyclophilin A)